MRLSYFCLTFVLAVSLHAAPDSNVDSEERSHLYLLSEDGCGRATAYSQTNKIVTIGTKTHVAWLDSEGDTFLVRTRTLDRRTGTWSPTYTVGEAFDNHGGPALTVDSSGYLHIVYYPHHHPFRYCRSVRPNDASEWTEEIQFGNRCTYPALLCGPDDTLYLACRESSREGQWVLNFYWKHPDREWEGPRTLLHGDAPSGYTRWQASLAFGKDADTIHMSFMIYEDRPEGIGYAVGYLRSPDSGKTWERSDGTEVSLPATPTTMDVVEAAPSSESPLNMRVGCIAVDPSGVPWFIYSRLDRQPFESWLAHPNGEGGWTKQSILPAAQDQWPDRGVQTPGEIVFDRDGVMYVAVTTVLTDRDAEGLFWGAGSDEIGLFVSRDRGQSFQVYQVSRPDSETPNWLPNMERPTTPDPIGVPGLIYTHGQRGETNKDILSNDVFWCDVGELIRMEK